MAFFVQFLQHEYILISFNRNLIFKINVVKKSNLIFANTIKYNFLF